MKAFLLIPPCADTFRLAIKAAITGHSSDATGSLSYQQRLARFHFNEPPGGRFRALAVAIGLFSVLLVGCGGAGSTTTSSATLAPANTVTTTTRTQTVTAAKPSGEAPRSSSHSRVAERGAASFRKPHSDNSIPDFGREARPSERQRAAATLASFLRARADREWSRVCTYLTSPTRSQLEMFAKSASKPGKTEGCGRLLAAFYRKTTTTTRLELPTSDVAAVRVKGSAAFALFHAANGEQYVMPMQNEGGAWKMGQIAPLPYPLGTPAAPAPGVP